MFPESSEKGPASLSATVSTFDNKTKTIPPGSSGTPQAVSGPSQSSECVDKPGRKERNIPGVCIKTTALQNGKFSPQRLSILYGPQKSTKNGQRASFVRFDRDKIDKKHRQYHTYSMARSLEQKDVISDSPGSSYRTRRGISVLGRADSIRREHPLSPEKKNPWKRSLPKPWVCCSRTMTCCILGCCLSKWGMKSSDVQQAWREKVTLCAIIILIILSVAFLTFGFNELICGFPPIQYHVSEVGESRVIINGKVYNLHGFQHPALPEGAFTSSSLFNGIESMNGKDLSFLFQQEKGSCKEIIQVKSSLTLAPSSKANSLFPCIPIENNAFNGTIIVNPTANPSGRGCHKTTQYLTNCLAQTLVGEVFYYWSDIQMTNSSLVVFDGNVLDLDRLRWISPQDFSLPTDMLELISTNPQMGGKDITFFLNRNPRLAKCLLDTIKVGVVDSKTIGCILADIFLILSLMAIVAIVVVRFLLAVYFGWVVSWRMGAVANESFEQRREREKELEIWADTNDIRISRRKDSVRKKSLFGNIPRVSRFTVPLPGAEPGRKLKAKGKHRNMQSNLSCYPSSHDTMEPDRDKNAEKHHTSRFFSIRTKSYIKEKSTYPIFSSPCLPLSQHPTQPNQEPEYPLVNFDPLHCILLVTCYSEGKEGLRTTLESLATTHYPVSHKLILVIADGRITGAGNEMSTPDICLSMLGDEIVPLPEVQAYSYVAIADGQKRHNTAKVYAGYYQHEHQVNTVKVPMIVIIKWGTPEEEGSGKPGNRGKRDSQIMLMSFFQKVMFDERMSPLEYELFNMMWKITGISPDKYELLMMVDADTKVHKDSLTHMAACMAREDLVMGCCGETKIANKNDSWVTMMQVFEYHISHHLSKSFESIFGGVTCLPGCFSMYRIKSRKGPNGFWVPILANPDIIEHYSENIVDTLHKKNLLLLGEDRYLTTLMLKTFPKRKMLFVPQAICKTVVPDTFAVLLSQRRRWINSTVHNMLELVLVRDLCGIFCFSMQFFVFMELIGTVVLPAAIIFTLYLLIISFLGKSAPVIPLVLLSLVLGLPALLILSTTRRFIYLWYMIVYLLTLPIWNLVLPSYAYWHFDDFTWGQTRQVEGDVDTSHDHSRKEGEFDNNSVPMNRWLEWERIAHEQNSSTLMVTPSPPPLQSEVQVEHAHVNQPSIQPSITHSDGSDFYGYLENYLLPESG